MKSFVIVIPTCNRPGLLPAAVGSALDAAGRANGAVLVVDDGARWPAADTLAAFRQPILTVVLNTGVHGPGAARNFGVARSREDVIFFLDDDDVIDPAYCQRILQTAIPAGADFGFSAVREGPRLRRRKLPAGLFPDGAPLAQRLAGLGMGFWIRRAAFVAVDGIDQTMPVNEDTDFCLRLAGAGLRGWYDPAAAVTLRPTPPAAADAHSVTAATDADRRARAFETILARHADLLSRHTATRRQFIRRVVKYRARTHDREAIRAAICRETGLLARRLLRLEASARLLLNPG